MNWNHQSRPGVSIVFGIVVALLPLIAKAEICAEIEALKNFSANDRIKSDYFDEYSVSRKAGVYHVYSRKQKRLEFSNLVAVMARFEDYPRFMPGYKGIQVKQGTKGEVLTAIRFRPAFSPFTSQFTNRVEIVDIDNEYKQCWSQLDEKDEQVIEDFKSAPLTNKGIWRFIKKKPGVVEIHYFSVIEPPLSIPGWLYRKIIKNSYEEVFKAIISTAQKR